MCACEESTTNSTALFPGLHTLRRYLDRVKPHVRKGNEWKKKKKKEKKKTIRPIRRRAVVNKKKRGQIFFTD